jgi:hypothetical protein
MGALTCNYSGGSLPAWATWHNQVIVQSMMFKNSSKVWTDFNNTNSTTSKFHWPTGVSCPDPQDYNFDVSQLSSSIVYASLKK